MNRTALKNYAPQARRDFIQAMMDRAVYYGLAANKIEPVVQKGDVAVIGGREHPRAVAGTRKQLEERIKRYGFEPTMEAMAYTWFNRLVAIRFMELHGYLEHGYRVLSHPEGKPTPEILERAEHVSLAGLKHDVVIDLKLAGNKEGELYRLLLTAQCNALHAAMPFLFERIDDETELLLPDNLLHSDSLIRKLVSEIDEQDWQQVEIIGWLYQFYISDRKAEVIGKVVPSEDIPAATELFTPNWIVKYLTQNTVGRHWLATYPQSSLREQMDYYIGPAEQTPEVQERLKEITPSSLNPEELTLLDPACGSGHILVEAYDLFKAIYQERGYRAKDIPALILKKNLFGLEIDDRAAQLAAFALMMKARADDRRIFDEYSKPNILALQDSQGMNAADITQALNAPINKDDIPNEHLFEDIQENKDGLFSTKALAEKGHVSQVDIVSLLDIFKQAKTLGSLIQIPSKLSAKLPVIEKRLDDVLKHGNLTHSSAHVIKPLLQQARFLSRQYDAVAANPPYMGMGAMNGVLKDFILERYEEAKIDTYAAFMMRCLEFARPFGFASLVTMHSWLFVFRFDAMRRRLLTQSTLDSLLHLGPGAFPEITGQVVQVCSFAFHKLPCNGYRPIFHRVLEGDSDDKARAVRDGLKVYSGFQQEVFLRTPGTTVCYWAGANTMRRLTDNPPLDSVATPRHGMVTSDNARFVRFWHEVELSKIGRGFKSRDEAAKSSKKWFPYNKGGTPCKWYGNTEYVVNWENDGAAIIEYARELYGSPSRKIQSPEFYFQSGLTWSSVTMKDIALRANGHGYLFDSGGSSMFFKNHIEMHYYLGLLNSCIATHYMRFLSPTINVNAGDLARIPIVPQVDQDKVKAIARVAERAVALVEEQSSFCEEKWEFSGQGVCQVPSQSIKESCEEWFRRCSARAAELRGIQQQVDQSFIQLYGLGDEVGTPNVADVKTDGSDKGFDRVEEIGRLLSFAIGCMMGRYALGTPGPICASNGRGFDPTPDPSFRADGDGIIPILETDWGIRDDSTSRVVEFIGVVWPKEHLEENLKFLADSLGPSSNEQPRQTIRRYLATSLYKNHLSMYKRRPIYWLFSSGKQRAFQCLIYLHRYHEGTLARMRTEYVIPLQGQIAARIEQLEGDKAKATSTSHRNKLQKEQTDLKKQHAELLIFEEKLKHLADQKIALDLDDGVKVNYAKFGDLLAESKVITGGKDDE
jgi:hypothetical protein